MNDGRRRAAILAAAFLLATACGSGGDDDPSSEVTTPEASQPTDAASDTVTDSSGETGPIDGALVTISGVGLYAVDRTTGEHRRVEVPGVEGVAVDPPPVVADGVAWFLTYDTLPGQSYSQTVYLTALDLATGTTRQVATVGVTRTADDSQDLTEYDDVAVTGSTVWVQRGRFGSGERELVGYDTASGAEQRVVALAGPSSLVSDGTQLFVLTDTALARVDPATGAVTELSPRFPDLADVLKDTGATVDDLVITRSETPIPADEAESLAGFLSLRLDALAVGPDGLWVSASGSASTQDGDLALSEVALRFDPVSGAITAAVPTTTGGTYFLDENSIDLGDESIAVSGGAAWVVDRQGNGQVLRLDAATGSAVPAYAPCPPELRCNNGEFLRSDPAGLWVELTRFSTPDSGGTSSGPITLDQLDPGTGALVRSQEVQDFIGS